MDNLRGAFLMVLAMLFFAIEDMFIKLLSDTMPTGEILIITGVAGGIVFWAMAAQAGVTILSKTFWDKTVVIRNLSEAVGTLCFVLAFTLGSITVASAVAQSIPLLVTMGGALFLGQKVGPRRWIAILVGLIGVLIIIRPAGADGVAMTSVLALFAALGLSGRDIATRGMTANVHNLQISTWAFFMYIPVGAGMMIYSKQSFTTPDTLESAYLIGCIIVGMLAYHVLVKASRIGDIGFISPFRYVRMVFAMMIGMFIFSEAPDFYTYLGAAIIIASGLYTLYRENLLRRQALRVKTAST